MTYRLLLICFISAFTFLASHALTIAKEEASGDKNVYRVKATYPVSSDITIVRNFPGVAEATQQVDLVFQVSGQIIELPIREGMVVQKGALLARLDSTNFEINVDKQTATLQEAEANLKRLQSLFERGNVSEANLDDAKLKHSKAKADLRTAEKALQDTEIRAPFSGHISSRHVDNFTYVNTMQNIVSLRDITEIDIIVNFPERIVAEIERVKQGAFTATSVAIFDFAPDIEFPLTFSEISIEADPLLQTFEARLRIEQETLDAFSDKLIILPGMNASVRINVHIENENKGVYIPISAVFGYKGNDTVWVIDQQTQTISPRAIRYEQLSKGRFFVVEGLSEADLIVIAGVHILRENAHVEVFSLQENDQGDNI